MLLKENRTLTSNRHCGKLADGTALVWISLAVDDVVSQYEPQAATTGELIHLFRFNVVVIPLK